MTDGEHRLGLLIGRRHGEMLKPPPFRRVPSTRARLALLDLINEATRNYKLARASWD